jgi:puromycin-sensitive aminopeptidase
VSESRYRLPRTVVPTRYELTLEPDLATFTFDGRVAIEVEVAEPTATVVLNAHELQIACENAAVDLDEELERVTLTFDEAIPAGTATIDLTFTGILNDKLAGFYRSIFKDDDGNEHVIATTQFESTDARRAFPCFDEPDFKAVFAVTLVVDDGLLAISNGPAVADDPHPEKPGKRVVRFADTMKMSTYLVAFVVGPLVATDPVDVDGTPLRVIHTPAKEHMAPFSLEAGASSLRFFRDYFGLDYPGDKLDLIALPDFAFGAMENLGAVTFRETALLVDSDNASRLEHERVADVVAHEIAHMWFGDLVTMKWWNGIWLNEAFATFMELLAVDHFKPQWERWVSFATGRAAAMVTDGMRTTRPVEFPVEAPEEAEGMFDVLTYQKGASVVRMLEQYLGSDEFRSGIRLYMDRHQYGNTETTDLWDAIEEATGEAARSTMDSWIFHRCDAAPAPLPLPPDGRRRRRPLAGARAPAGQRQRTDRDAQAAAHRGDGDRRLRRQGRLDRRELRRFGLLPHELLERPPPPPHRRHRSGGTERGRTVQPRRRHVGDGVVRDGAARGLHRVDPPVLGRDRPDGLVIDHRASQAHLVVPHRERARAAGVVRPGPCAARVRPGRLDGDDR